MSTKVIDLIAAEVARATAKFPTWPTDPLHALAVLGEEFGELTKAMLQLTYEPHKTSADEVRTEAIQTAAMAVRLALSLDAYEYQRAKQHQQQLLLAPAAPANVRERWNIERDGDALMVCFNNHEKHEGCRYERFVPQATAATQWCSCEPTRCEGTAGCRWQAMGYSPLDRAQRSAQHHELWDGDEDSHQLRFMTDENHELYASLDGTDPFFGCPEDWHEKAIARFCWAHDRGDPGVGMQARFGWILADNQCGTVLADLAGIGGDDHARVAMEVLAARRRQIDVEGWTPKHDDEHGWGDLADAAACYISGSPYWSMRDKHQRWPWELADWKPKDRRTNLIRAAALLLAEIERLDRAAPAGTALPEGERGSQG